MTLLIKNVRVLGAEPEYPEISDVFVSGDRISAIGRFPLKPADETVDGKGAWLSPGFIDVHAESDHHRGLFEHRIQDHFLRQGVTSIVLGHRGISLAPIFAGNRELLLEWTDGGPANIGWDNMGGFLDILRKHPLGVNIGTFVGHATLKAGLTGQKGRALTRAELDALQRLAGEAMDEGALGLSVDPYSLFERGMEIRELRELAALVRRKNKVMAIGSDATNGHLGELMETVLDLGRMTQAKILLTDLTPLKGDRKKHAAALAALESAPPDVRFETSPFPERPLPLWKLLPAWAWRPRVSEMAEELADEWFAAKIQKELSPLSPDGTWIVKADRHMALVGLSLREFMKAHALRSTAAACVKLMRMTGLRAWLLVGDLDPESVGRALGHPRAFVGSRGVSVSEETRVPIADYRHNHETYPDVLGRAEQSSWEEFRGVIRQLTAEPAGFFGFADRGEIAEGTYADLAVFRDGVVACTVVGGRVAWQDGRASGVLAGKVLGRKI